MSMEPSITDPDVPVGKLEASKEIVQGAKPKRKNRGSLRKRPALDSDEETPATTAATARQEPVKKSQRNGKESAPLAFSTKRQDRSELFRFESTERLQVRPNDVATRASEIHAAADGSTGNHEGTTVSVSDANGAIEGTQVYRGMSGYRDYRAGFRREQTTGSGKGLHGPLRAPTNVRTSIRVDYQPDICKDYKETGYCGFGDACKFLHDRGDYKAGWELDREWEEKQKERQARMLAMMENGLESKGDRGAIDGESDELDSDDDELPFACFICRRPWSECQDPVVTRCKHYFCEQCALKHNAKSSKCYVCEQPTGGIFNVANDVIRREKEGRRKENG